MVLLEMAQASQVSAEIYAEKVPTLDEAWEFVRKGKIPAATHANLRFVNPHLYCGNGITQSVTLMLADPQTAGGLLIAVPSDKTEELIARLQEVNTPAAAHIGRITDVQDKRLILHL